NRQLLLAITDSTGTRLLPSPLTLAIVLSPWLYSSYSPVPLVLHVGSQYTIKDTLTIPLVHLNPMALKGFIGITHGPPSTCPNPKNDHEVGPYFSGWALMEYFDWDTHWGPWYSRTLYLPLYTFGQMGPLHLFDVRHLFGNPISDDHPWMVTATISIRCSLLQLRDTYLLPHQDDYYCRMAVLPTLIDLELVPIAIHSNGD
ncbi:hypothetical protein G9A89_000569, partial [Geosiphon pyriformis]